MNAQKPVIVVTGGNRGIGFEICRQLAVRGAQVVLTARRPDAGDEAVKRLARQKPSAEFRPLDVTDPASAAALRDHLEGAFGRLDALINNAGILSKEDDSGLGVKLETLRATLETNTLAPLHLAQTLVPLLRRSSAARIVNVSSGMGALSEMQGGYAAYRISKTALNAVTAILAAELRGAVAVNAVCPGWVKTRAALRSLAEMARRAGREEQDMLEEVMAAQSLGGLMEPADIADIYLFLASEHAHNVTGQAYNIDRGEVMS
jgi:NAD(P)-dependent dehydrogenase (short-subunit alcohol dehydrogenase family)